MPKTVHTVAQSEHLASIASDAQLASFAKTWNDPDNAKLRQLREGPHQLLPGDAVTVPERDPLVYQKPTGAQHTFTVQIMPLKLRVVVLDELGKPIANTPGTLTANGTDQEVQTDGDGLIDATIDNGTTSATLVLGARTFALGVGHLDPIDQVSGQIGRLHALGYFDGDVPEAADFVNQQKSLAVQIHLAWELFQDANGLTVTGVGDDDTVKKLKDVYGC